MLKNLDPKAASEYLCLSKSTLANLRVSGDGPKFYKLGSRVIYSVADLHEWQDQRKVSSTSEVPFMEANLDG